MDCIVEGHLVVLQSHIVAHSTVMSSKLEENVCTPLVFLMNFNLHSNIIVLYHLTVRVSHIQISQV